MIKDFKEQWQGEKPDVYVMDAAFYTEENLKKFQYSINWISRVPFTLKASVEFTQTLLPEQFTESTLYQGYRFCTVCNEYAGIKQLWVVVESDERKSIFGLEFIRIKNTYTVNSNLFHFFTSCLLAKKMETDSSLFMKRSSVVRIQERSQRRFLSTPVRIPHI
jgi:hypothetical protein